MQRRDDTSMAESPAFLHARATADSVAFADTINPLARMDDSIMKLDRICTRSGDDGCTSLGDGARMPFARRTADKSMKRT